MGQPLCNEEKNNAQFVFYRIITHQLQHFPSMRKFLLPMTLSCLPLTKEIYQSARSVLSKRRPIQAEENATREDSQLRHYDPAKPGRFHDGARPDRGEGGREVLPCGSVTTI